MIRVRRQLDSQTGELRELKTKAAKREIPISSALRRLLLGAVVKCAALLDGYYDLSTLHDVSIPLGHSAGTQTVIASSPKISGGKVTGYNLVGTTTATPDTVNLGFIFTANAGPRPAGDHRRKTAALPNTPVVLPV